MKTVKELKKELSKFPDDALCFAYEGESIGIAIQSNNKEGFIYCCESNCKENKTKELQN